MAINFCLPMYKPKITSSTVSSDGYEIGNLISPDFRRSNQGFIAESFIKPPITITLEFVCNISIHSVVIAPSVGRQRSSSFEIYTKSIPSYKRSFNLDACVSHGSKTDQTSKVQISPYDTTDVLIGKGFSQSPDINLFKFENKKFFAREPFKDISANLTDHAGNFISRQLRHHRSVPLADVSHVTIRIVRVFGATIPCIKKLEVWGQPSFSNNQNILNSIAQIFTSWKIPKEANNKKQQNQQDATKALTSGGADSSSDNETMCPEEFIDPITIEVMALPVLLPSGHTVDQSTLDRYEIASAQWGRSKTDPFTGVPFSNTLKPIPHARLKTRIDKFLLTAGKEFDTVARTSGRSSSNAAQVSKITTEQLETNKVNKHLNEIHPHTGRSIPLQRCHAETEDSNKYSSHAVTSKPKYACQMFSNIQQKSRTTTKRNCNVIDVTTPPNKVRKTRKVTAHEQKLADSLEEAMNSILATRPKYRKIDISNSTEPPAQVCVSCQSQPINRAVFYRLPCQHLMCRHCVTREGNDKCTTCGLAFNNFDIVRVHLS